jgi:hypothetical protein
MQGPTGGGGDGKVAQLDVAAAHDLHQWAGAFVVPAPDEEVEDAIGAVFLPGAGLPEALILPVDQAVAGDGDVLAVVGGDEVLVALLAGAGSRGAVGIGIQIGKRLKPGAAFEVQFHAGSQEQRGGDISAGPDRDHAAACVVHPVDGVLNLRCLGRAGGDVRRIFHWQFHRDSSWSAKPDMLRSTASQCMPDTAFG